MLSLKIRKWSATHQRVRILFWLFHYLLISLYETWWCQEIYYIKTGHSCTDPLIHSRVPFHFAAAWFPKKEFCKGIEFSNRGEIKTKLLTLPAAAQSRADPSTTMCTLLANVPHILYEIDESLYQINWRMRKRSRCLLYRGNIKPRTFDIAEINFGNFLGLPTTIQVTTEVMQSEKEKSGAMLFKTKR